MSATRVDEIYNQAKQLSSADRQQLFDRLLMGIAPQPPSIFYAEEQLQQMLHAGVSSGPAMPMTESDWNDIRQEVHARAARRSGPQSNNA